MRFYVNYKLKINKTFISVNDEWKIKTIEYFLVTREIIYIIDRGEGIIEIARAAILVHRLHPVKKDAADKM